MTTNEAKARRVYWLCDQLSDRHRSRAQLMARHGFQIQFFPNFEALRKELVVQRAPIIVLGDEAPPATVEQQIQQVLTLPDAQGALLLLSVSHPNERIATLAACSSFRDLIPIDLEETFWATRFIFATSRKLVPVAEPDVQLSINSVSALAVPARVVWMSESRMLIETKMQTRPGAVFSMTSGFCEALGVKKIALTVEESRRTDLRYRFSDAILVRWAIPDLKQNFVRDIFAKLRQTHFGQRCKAFIAVQSQELRAKLVRELDPLKFEVNIALQKQSIVNEPRFFCPHIVFIEEKLAVGDEFMRFRRMLEVLPQGVPVYVIGAGAQAKLFQAADPARRIGILPKVPERLADLIFAKLLPADLRRNMNADENAIFLGAEHPYSIAEIQFPARMTRVHPRFVQVVSTQAVGVYGLARIENPLLRKYVGVAPYAKVIASYASPHEESTGFAATLDCYLCDVGRSAQNGLALALVKMLDEKLTGKTARNVVSNVVAAEGALSTKEKNALLMQQAVGQSPNAVAKLGNTAAALKIAPPNATTRRADEGVIEIELGQAMQNAAGQVAKKARRVANNKNLHQVLGFIFFVIFAVAAIYGLAMQYEPTDIKSGSIYTDSLRKYAPSRFGKDGEQKPEE